MRYINRDGNVIYTPVVSDKIIREDGRVERLCSHGVGHPIGHTRRWEKWMEMHGCDGCCCFFEGFEEEDEEDKPYEGM